MNSWRFETSSSSTLSALFSPVKAQGRDFCVFAGDWHECFSGLEPVNLRIAKTHRKTGLTGMPLATRG